MAHSLSHLRRLSTSLVAKAGGKDRVALGCREIDAVLQGGLGRGALHEICASCSAHMPAASAVALSLAAKAAGGRPLLWARESAAGIETGRPYPPGLGEICVDPGRLVFVSARDGTAVLKAGAEAARCNALGAVVIEPHGLPRGLDLTASRRLLLAAEASGVLTLLLTLGEPASSAAATRWMVSPAASRALQAGAPGWPSFVLRLVRQRGGVDRCEWCVEWDRDRTCFQLRTEPAPRREPVRAALSGPVAAFPGDRPAAAAERAEQRDIAERRAG
jgi:protein ImuA